MAKRVKLFFVCYYAAANDHQILFKTWEDGHRNIQNAENCL
jgi:hypothetical protein